MTRSTVAPISKVGSQGHSPLPYQAGRCDRKWRSCRIRARARIERELSLRVLAGHPPSSCVTSRLFSSHSPLSISTRQDLYHTRAVPSRSAPRSTTHWQGSLRDTCYFLLDFSPSPAADCSSPLPPPLPLSTTFSSPLRRLVVHVATLITARSERRIDLTLDYVADFIEDESWDVTYELVLRTSVFPRCLTVITTHPYDDYVQAIAGCPRSTNVTWRKRKLLLREPMTEPECHVAVMHDDAGISCWHSRSIANSALVRVSLRMTAWLFLQSSPFTRSLVAITSGSFLFSQRVDTWWWRTMTSASVTSSLSGSAIIIATLVAGILLCTEDHPKRLNFFWIVKMTLSAFISRVLFSSRSSHAIHSLGSF